ncbi:pheophytinase, chloroplastic isoform X1 [Nymphaea colorata]|nr:pheophytinase, chloroplastic isoform X1 [Nymphaea colorata]XP_049935626.1 pheophytinase, chloroplastic isoform X1 [Nymphaea colorata]
MELLSISSSSSHLHLQSCCPKPKKNEKWCVSARFRVRSKQSGRGSLKGGRIDRSRLIDFLRDSRPEKLVQDFEDDSQRIVIPGLPEYSGEGEAESSISRGFWEWKPRLRVYYETAGSENLNSPAVLFLPGFGVGAFHFEKQLMDLGREYRVWAVDFLGQGMSLPAEDPAPSDGGHDSEGQDLFWGFGKETEPWAEELAYSVDLWRDQIRDFVEQVIGQPVYVVGNSLGGFVAVYLAASNPELVKGVTLLNATPFWGLLPNPVTSPKLARLFPWAGTFPLPQNLKKFLEFVWRRISDPRSIDKVLKQVYADGSIKTDRVLSRILEITQHPAAAASFASIMFAPKGQLSFQESLSRCEMNKVPVCLVYGREDPWVKPVWGRQVKRQLPEAPYYEISPAGHCPHDEVPEVVNYLLRGWIGNLESDGAVSLPLLDDLEFVEDDLSREVEFHKEGSRKLVRVHFFGSNVSVWNSLNSLFRSRMSSL